MKLFCAKCQKVFEAETTADSSKVKCPLCGDEQEFPQTVPGPGVVVGDFLIEKLLSRGGMGEVFLAKQISLDRPVALKVLQQKHIEDREYVESLFKEARAAAKLSHPNIVQAYAVGEDNGIFYFAMEYIRGKTFKQILKEEKTIEFTRAATVIRDIARAIGAAWREQKLVHQDIKPDNIMLDSNGFAKLADLGLAKVATGSPDESDDDDKVLGTPQYISPEQLTGVPTDIRSDIYSLGATFYHFVTGRFPYVAKTGDEIARMHVESTLQPPKEVNPALPDKLNGIIVKMMEKDINKRYQSAEELIADLDAYLRSAPVAAKSPAKPVAAKLVPKPVVAKPVPKPVVAKPVPKPVAVPKAAVPKLAIPGQKSAPQMEPPVAPAQVEEPPPPETPESGEAFEEDNPGMSRLLKITLISVASVVLVVIILMAVLVMCVKSGTDLPSGVDSLAETVAGWFGVSSPPKNAVGKDKVSMDKDKNKTKKKASGNGADKAVVKEKRDASGKGNEKAGNKAKGKTSGKTKAKPVKKVQELKPEQYESVTSLQTDTQEQVDNFLRKANILLKKGAPKDARARKAYSDLKEKYDIIKREEDERIREQRRAEEERRRREEEERREEELRRREEEARREAERRRREAEEQRNYNKLKAEVLSAMKLLVEGFYAAVDGDEAAFRNALPKADEVYIRDGENSRERKLIADYRDFREKLPGELMKFREFRKFVGDIDDDIIIYCKVPEVGTVRVKALYPDGSAKVIVKSREGRIPADTFAQSPNFKKSLEGNLKDRSPNALFYYCLMIRRFDPEAMRKAPAGFWKRHIRLFTEAAGSSE